VRIYLSVDIEGVAGVVDARSTSKGQGDYERYRALMVGEANAAVAGAFDAGATAVVVNDSHDSMDNLVPMDLDPRAEVILGRPKPRSMVTGIDDGSYDLALFVGYHAGGGDAPGVLAHTYSWDLFWAVRVNGERVSEAELNAMVAGAFGVPLGLVTGDQTICAVVQQRLPGVHTLAVKHSIGFSVARSVHPTVAQERIRVAARDAVAAVSSFTPYRPPAPYALEVDMVSQKGADAGLLVPGTDRIGPRTLRFVTDDAPEVLRALLAWLYVAHAAG
jgi:D-amino peptidase